MTVLRVVLIVLTVLLSRSVLSAAEVAVDDDGTTSTVVTNEENAEPAEAVLFPWFVQALGIAAFVLISRCAPAVPYTAVLFLLGTIMGIGTARLQHDSNLAVSMLEFWFPINSELLLLVFLPGLVFKDASSLSVHLFQKSVGQCLIFAFPMVLAGTVLTALIAFYIFPYDWSFHLCMTFGSILAATDPVAVAALLDAVGAPPRLKMHIAGESLLNDGSAIVFFTIFSSLYLFELGIADKDEDIDWAAGIALFVRMSLGGAATGLFFGGLLLAVFRILNRRLSREENVVEVAASVTTAYMCYYTAEVVWGCSGVIATVVAGLVIAAAGRPLINDWQLLQDFWSLLEHLLNTVLFALGGLVWGSIIANTEERRGGFTSSDWGYLFLLYILLTVIRFALFGIAFPVYSRIGLKSNWQEMVFQSYGGLRGAVGIALAIFLDNEVRQATSGQNRKFELETNKLFGFVGGIAFLTLIVNATLAGPLLRKLGLADSTNIRHRVLESMERQRRENATQDLVGLLTQRRFRRVDFATVRHHVFLLKNLTKKELMEAVKKYHASNKHRDHYRAPKLEHILPYILADEDGVDDYNECISLVEHHRRASIEKGPMLASVAAVATFKRHRGNQVSKPLATTTATEMRGIFLEVLRSTYEHQIDLGELFNSEFVAVSLLQSIDFSIDAISRGAPLDDFEYTRLITLPATVWIHNIHGSRLLRPCVNQWCMGKAEHSLEREKMKVDVELCLAFLHGHRKAQEIFHREFVHGEFSQAQRIVIQESETGCRKAEALLRTYPVKDVELVVSHKFCIVLLNKSARYIEKLHKLGFLKSTEAEERMEEIEVALRNVLACPLPEHPGEQPMHDKPLMEEDDKGIMDVSSSEQGNVALRAAPDEESHLTQSGQH